MTTEARRQVQDLSDQRDAIAAQMQSLRDAVAAAMGPLGEAPTASLHTRAGGS